jgi:regulatory protein
MRIKTIPSAYNKIIDLLSRRDHSEKELRQKLRRRFPQEEIDAALSRVKNLGFLPNPQQYAERFANSASQKNKGALWIKNKLRERGLPEVALSPDIELDKAMHLLDNMKGPWDRAKAYRRLRARGIEHNIAMLAINKSPKNKLTTLTTDIAENYEEHEH